MTKASRAGDSRIDTLFGKAVSEMRGFGRSNWRTGKPRQGDRPMIAFRKFGCLLGVESVSSGYPGADARAGGPDSAPSKARATG
jgi:hypothetical protein